MAELTVLPCRRRPGWAAATPPRIDPPRPQQKLDGLGLGGDGLGTGLRPGQDPGCLAHHAGDLAQQVDLIGKLALGIGQLAESAR